MRKAYLFVYGDIGTREEVKAHLDGIPEILDWRYEMPNCFYLISEESADALARKIRKSTGERGRFIVSEITQNKQGWLPKDTWTLLNTKRRASK